MSVALFRRIISNVQELTGVSEVVIAGGAIRDHLADKPYKDIDVFIKCSSKQAMGNYAIETRRKYSYIEDESMIHNKDELYQDSLCQGVTNFKAGLNSTMQLIGWDVGGNGPQEFAQHLFEEFDFGFCQFAMDQDGNALMTADAELDLKFQHATLINVKSTKGFSKSLKRFTSWKRTKYPNLKLQLGANWFKPSNDDYDGYLFAETPQDETQDPNRQSTAWDTEESQRRIRATVVETIGGREEPQGITPTVDPIRVSTPAVSSAGSVPTGFSTTYLHQQPSGTYTWTTTNSRG